MSDSVLCSVICSSVFLFFFNDTATTEIYTLSLHDALPIPRRRAWRHSAPPRTGRSSTARRATTKGTRNDAVARHGRAATGAERLDTARRAPRRATGARSGRQVLAAGDRVRGRQRRGLPRLLPARLCEDRLSAHSASA